MLGRSILGNSPLVGPDEKSFFDEMFRTKSATAQWICLSDTKNSN